MTLKLNILVFNFKLYFTDEYNNIIHSTAHHTETASLPIF